MNVKGAAMWTPSRIKVLLACVCLAGVPVAVSGDETLLCDRYINAVPYTISKPGHYCLKNNISTSMFRGTAITIESDSVWLDLNNFILDGSAAGPGTEASGIVSTNYRDITVRNGVVRGFMFGIELGTGARGRNYNVEHIRAEGNTVGGIFIISSGGPGGGHTVRNNVVIDTGGSTVFGAFGAFAIVVGGGGHVSGNEVIGVTGNVPTNAIAFNLREGTAIVSDNRVSEAGVGFRCDSPQKYLRDNTAVVTPVTGVAYSPGCTKIGINNFP